MPSRLGEREQAVILEIVGELQPEERFLAADYFEASRRRRIFRSSPVDFGLETELTLITPPVTMVVMWAFGVVQGEVRAIVEERIRSFVRRAFKIEDPVLPVEPAPAAEPRADSSAERDLSALRIDLAKYGVALGLTPQRAEILAELAVAKAQDVIR